MKKQWLVWPVLLSLCALACGQDGASSDLKKMQGKWTPTALYLAQEPVPEEGLPAFAVTFEGETMTLEAGAVAISRLDAIRDSSKKPKTLDYISANGPTKGQTAYGIYELDGDSLKISIANFGEARPNDYSIPEKGRSERVVMILRRAK